MTIDPMTPTAEPLFANPAEPTWPELHHVSDQLKLLGDDYRNWLYGKLWQGRIEKTDEARLDMLRRAQAAEEALAKLRLDHAAQSYDLGKAQGEAEGATMQLGALTRERDDLKTKVNNQRRVLSGQAVQLEELKAEREGLRGEVELLDAVRAAANAAWVAFQESSPRQGIAMHELRIAMNRLDAQRAPIAKQAPAAEGPECNCDPEDTGPMMHMKDCPVRVAREAPAAEGREPKRHTSECQGYDPDCECNTAACRRAALPQVAQASALQPPRTVKGSRVMVDLPESDNHGAIGHIAEHSERDPEYEWRVRFGDKERDGGDVWFRRDQLVLLEEASRTVGEESKAQGAPAICAPAGTFDILACTRAPRCDARQHYAECPQGAPRDVRDAELLLAAYQRLLVVTDEVRGDHTAWLGDDLSARYDSAREEIRKLTG